MSKSTRSTRGRKSPKDFPLTPHPRGYWCKKVKGKLQYFGKIVGDENGQAALAKWLDTKDDLLAGRTPRTKSDGLTVADLANKYLSNRASLRDAGELAPRTFERYFKACEYLVDAFGKNRLVDDLGPEDFQTLRTRMANRWGAVSLGNEIQMIRTVFRFGYENNIMDKPVSAIFSEFEGKEYEDEELLGDVKYHLGYSKDVKTRSGKKVHVTLAPNPSHLEAVDPVVEGLARSIIDRVYAGDNNKVAAILVHGDASVSGQGIIYELLQMADLEGYTTGGTIHLVVNNQIGFTTNYLDGRSSVYCTDVAKTIQSPVFHVNADDAEAVVYTVMLAMEFRAAFHRDIFIDLLGYRKYGHNESDEPRFTQPVLYKIIEQHPDPLEIYLKKLEEENILSSFDVAGLKAEINTSLEKEFETAKTIGKGDIAPFLDKLWERMGKANPRDFDISPVTAVTKDIFHTIGSKLTVLPAGKNFFRKIVKMQEDRKAMVDKELLDWAMAELLAYGTLLDEGHPVRLSGQDCQRGTFSHRHAVLTVEDSEEKFIPLNFISPGQAKFSIYNSLLSEYGVLGFEYGYGYGSPQGVTIWEAQFGDFSNGAQVIIDQYISSAEDKWKVMNGIVLLLPHGYEGQGPEHSSARLERFLSLCGHHNMQI
ncbi:MAG: thiamine pyrophosphate-dependent enzyme, partial [Syntrophus sp. (in: bacteria)]